MDALWWIEQAKKKNDKKTRDSETLGVKARLPANVLWGRLALAVVSCTTRIAL